MLLVPRSQVVLLFKPQPSPPELETKGKIHRNTLKTGRWHTSISRAAATTAHGFDKPANDGRNGEYKPVGTASALAP